MKILLLALSLITPEETTWVRVNAPEGISFLFPNAPQKITKNVDGIPTVIYQTKDLACVAGVVCSDLSAKHLRMDGKMALQIYENMKAATLEMETVVLRDEMTVPYDNMLIKEIQYSITKDNHEMTYYKRFIFRDNHIYQINIGAQNRYSDLLEKELKKIGLKVKTRPVEIGYDVRCQDPVAYDLTYCTELAMGVYQLYSEGKTGCMVYVDAYGNVSPLYLSDLQDPATGKIPPRVVDINSGTAQNYYNYIAHYVTEADYEAAKAFVSDPEAYDFKKILNW